MTGETIKVVLMLALVGGLELALHLPQIEFKRIRTRSRHYPKK